MGSAKCTVSAHAEAWGAAAPSTKNKDERVSRCRSPVEEMMKVGRHFVGAALPFSSVTRILLVILMRKQISARLQENETCSSRKAECSSQASSSAARPVSRPLGIFLYALLSRRPCRLLASLSVDSAVRVRVIISRCGNSSHWSQIVSERRDCPALFQSCAKESRATPTIICAPLITMLTARTLARFGPGLRRRAAWRQLRRLLRCVHAKSGPCIPHSTSKANM